jgi:ADP-ribose pyrophosphatase YjhB (NUDIX family)
MSHLYDINNVFNILENKTIVSKKNYYCNNCNKKGHIFKSCNEPKISNGIIAFNIKNFKKSLIPILEKYIKKNYNNPYFMKNNNIDYNSDIKFLMVQRKHSLGFLEFIRGKYNINNIDTISFLIEQMTKNEINNIKQYDFDYLWNNVWNNNQNEPINNNINYQKEYILSKQKFYNLKLNNSDIFNIIFPKFNFNEWGFPKGRRNLYEPDIVCAMREFEEETSLKENHYTVLEECNYIRENLKGTNGLDYAHNYFYAIMDNDINNNNNNKNNKEISNMQFMKIEECLNVIRPYHTNKIKIIKNIYNIINKFIQEHD